MEVIVSCIPTKIMFVCSDLNTNNLKSSYALL